MKNVTFYLLENDIYQDGLSSVEQLVCEIVAEYWRDGKRVLIACKDKQQAILLDKALWVRPSESFIPHNLFGNGPERGAPIEITWLQKRDNNAWNVLVNLNVEFVDFAITFTKVIDFVPCEESLKELARRRYKLYRLAGFNLNLATWGC